MAKDNGVVYSATEVQQFLDGLDEAERRVKELERENKKLQKRLKAFDGSDVAAIAGLFGDGCKLRCAERYRDLAEQYGIVVAVRALVEDAEANDEVVGRMVELVAPMCTPGGSFPCPTVRA